MCRFDTDVAIKHEYVGRGEDGFPMMQGGQEEVTGKHLEIWYALLHLLTMPAFWPVSHLPAVHHDAACNSLEKTHITCLVFRSSPINAHALAFASSNRRVHRL